MREGQDAYFTLGAAAAWVNAQKDWAPLEVVGDFMRDRVLELIASFPWVQAQTRTSSRDSE